MKADLVLGMNFGSEAKGAAISRILHFVGYDMSMRVQSTQAGHTIWYKDKEYKMQSIPCAWTDPNVELLLGPGCFTERKLLLDEINMINEAMGGDVRDRLFVDRRVWEVTDADKAEEARAKITEKQGSTGHGCGASLVLKMWRTRADNVDFMRWCDDNGIKTVDTIEHMRNAYVLVEGCQGAMLAIHTSPYFPYVTSRECTASGILGECGISPFDVANVTGVFRTLPIRVGGNSGPTGGNEISWQEVSNRAGYDVGTEITTVTKRPRRIFEFSDQDFIHALRVNRPNRLYMTFANYITPCFGIERWKDISPTSQAVLSNFIFHINKLSRSVGNWGTVEQINTGPLNKHWLYVR